VNTSTQVPICTNWTRRSNIYWTRRGQSCTNKLHFLQT